MTLPPRERRNRSKWAEIQGNGVHGASSTQDLMRHLLALHQTLSSLPGISFWPWFTLKFFFKDLAEIIIPTAFSCSDHILPLPGIPCRKVACLGYRSIPPKTSKSRAFQGDLSSVFLLPFCQLAPFLPPGQVRHY